MNESCGRGISLRNSVGLYSAFSYRNSNMVSVCYCWYTTRVANSHTWKHMRRQYRRKIPRFTCFWARVNLGFRSRVEQVQLFWPVGLLTVHWSGRCFHRPARMVTVDCPSSTRMHRWRVYKETDWCLPEGTCRLSDDTGTSSYSSRRDDNLINNRHHINVTITINN